MAAVFVVRWLLRRKAPAVPADNALQYAGAGQVNRAPQGVEPIYGALASAATAPALRLPEGFDGEAFLRVAKLNFVRLQAANDAKNLGDIRDFVAPELYAEIKMQMDERGETPQKTDVVTLDAELLEVVTEGQRHIASVHFSGMLREAPGATAVPFDEVWNLSKPVSGDAGWVIAGIQQLA